MHDISTDILALSGEAAVLVRRNTVCFANAPARHILGADCQGKGLKQLLGPGVAETQAPSFIVDLSIGGSRYAVRVNRFEDAQLIFLRPCDASPLLLNDALIYSMRNSLMNYSLSADMLRARAEEQGDAQLLEALRPITHSYYRMMRVLTNASTVLAVTQGSVIFSPEQLDLTALAASLADTVNMLYPQVELKLLCEQVQPIIADRQLVELILLNLISNSLVHGKGCTRVSLSLIDGRDSLILSVDDDGCGIAPEQLGSVFDRYCHGFDMGSMLSGAGLGLTVARSAAHLHGGTLLLESRQGRGTTVRVSFSRRLSAAALRSPRNVWEGGMQSILTGLADCLPDICYTEKYLD